ncbi:hypothetical protein M501DRAFT_804099 [Patellaria atrata CBS 101060]|uniref:LisH domain-containing protein n=1 Tax=Patellaria atrata CBS 101060 TaxID=1346257 RepID=A0A9P4SBA2_9PEZI|nr:hypothetical protein M501DRAFT_804099 [Patellaria atrata CBS 101060]
MNPQVNMAGIPVAGGPVGGTQLMNAAGQRVSEFDNQKQMLNTYIYDYFLKNNLYDLARNLQKDVPVKLKPKPSPTGRDVNGVSDGMDTDTKNEHPDLQVADIPYSGGDSFLHDWWCQFWEMYSAHRGKARPPVQQYLNHTRSSVRQTDQQRLMSNMLNNNPQMQYQMMQQRMAAQGGMGMSGELQKRALQNHQQRNASNPQANMQQLKQAQMMQTNMQRDGSGMDMGGQRPQSPAGENAPSPKRPRLEGNGFNNQQMGPAGRGQGMQPMGNAVSQAGGQQMMMQNGINTNEMPQQQFNAFQASTPNVQAKSIEGMNPSGVSQGSPMNQQLDPELAHVFSGNPTRPMMPQGPGGQTQGNHALQDYQMQLMLLEQQNKKRLLMARQEQDNLTHGPGTAPGQPGFQAMSPSGSRAGPSPNPNDQMKRGTPKMGQTGLPNSPLPDGSMNQNRGSPAPAFDGQMPGGMPPQAQYYQMIRQPPSSHPQFNGQMNQQQQMEAIARNGGRMPNGWTPQGAQMMAPNPGQQQVPMGTPQQRTAMPPPPPPATATEVAARTQPSSPAQQNAAPPTPSQTNKAAPKGKKDKQDTRKKPPKKGSTTTGATPASEAEPPPTPTPSTPITPMHQNSFAPAQKNGVQQNNVQAQSQNATNAPAVAPQLDPTSMPNFGDLGSSDANQFSLDFGSLDGPDVLENFDFDSFLHTGDDGNGFQFEGALNFSADGVEAGSGDV